MIGEGRREGGREGGKSKREQEREREMYSSLFPRVMVLDAGRIVEFDSPNRLIEEKGMFHTLARDAGLL